MSSRRVIAAALVTLTTLALSGCDGGATGGEPSDLAATAARDAGGEAACTSSGARDVVTRFLDSDGPDANHIVAMFIATEPEFQWFSTRERTGMEVAADRSSLAQYLEERRKRQVDQRLDEFQFNGVDGAHGNFGFVITDAAGEVNVTYPGKGAIHCTSGKIIVWSEGAPS